MPETFRSTGLRLNDRDGVPNGELWTHSGSGLPDGATFLCRAHIAGGAGGVVLLLIHHDDTLYEGIAYVSAATFTTLGGTINAPLEVREQRLSEQAKGYVSLEKALAVAAFLAAVVLILQGILLPSADQAAGRSQLAAELRTTQSRLVSAAAAGDLVTVQQQAHQLDSSLDRATDGDAGVERRVLDTLGWTFGILSALLTLFIAVRDPAGRRQRAS
jgi:hypothetical protein